MKRITTLGCLGLLFLANAALRASPVPPALKENERIIFLGDSITQGGTQPDGYVTLVSRSIAVAYPRHGIQVLGAGRGGNRVPDLLARLDRDVLSKQPSLVVIYIGINDVWHWTKPDPKTNQPRQGTTAADYEAGLRKMIQQVQAVQARVMLCTPSVIGERVDASDPNHRMLEQYSAIVRTVAKDTGAPLVDLRQAFIAHLREHNAAQADRGILTQDTVHLNKRGNRLVAEEVLRALGVPMASLAEERLPHRKDTP
jgi:lysophospholipase L1-like esterase